MQLCTLVRLSGTPPYNSTNSGRQCQIWVFVESAELYCWHWQVAIKLLLMLLMW
jgi:hypothetical protein